VLPPRSALNTVADNGEVDARSVTEAEWRPDARNGRVPVAQVAFRDCCIPLAEAEEWVAVVAREESRASYPAGPSGLGGR